MALDVRTTAPGPAALAELDQVLAGHQAGDPLAPVIVLVPSNAVGVATRRALARRRPIGNVQFLTAARFAESLGRARLAGRTPISVPLLEGALRATLATQPGRFTDVADHAATVGALRACYRSIRELPAADAQRLERQGSPLGREAARIVRLTHQRLAPRWFDATDVMDAALAALTEGHHPAGRVVVHLPEQDQPSAAAFVRALGDVTVIAALTGDPAGDAEVRSWLARLDPELDIPVPRPAPPAGTHVDVIGTSDPDDEVRAAVRQVVEHTRAGVALHRIALVWTARQPYARLVTDRLLASGLAFHGTDPVAVAERVTGRALLALLDVDRLEWRREDVFAVLAGAPMRLPSGRAVPTASWERVSRDAGVHRGTHWDQHLSRFAALRRAEAERRGEGPTDRRSREADRADALRAFVSELARDLGPRDRPDTWSAWALRSHRLIERYLGGDALRVTLDATEQRAFDRVQAALDRLADLDAVGRPVTRPHFRDALLAELESDLGRAGVAGTGVLVGPLGALIGADVDAVIVVGASDAALPGAPGFDPLLSDLDRRVAGGGLPEPEQFVRRQRRALAGVVAAVADLTVTVPRGDLRQSAERRESPWLKELIPAAARHRRDIASFGAGVAEAPFPATAQEHRVRALSRHARAGLAVDDHPLLGSEPALGRAVRLLRARSSPAFTEFDGNLAGLELPSPLTGERITSTTRLEHWASCPHRYLFEDLLRVEVVENPEDVLSISPLDRGNLLHGVLDRFHHELFDGALPMPAPHEPWPVAHRRRLLALLDEECDRVESEGLTGRPALWRRERSSMRQTLVWWLDRDDRERREEGLTIEGSEVRFGFGEPGGWPAAEIPLPDGRVVRLRGSIDRVDRSTDGSYRVVDHKTGNNTGYLKVPATIHDGGTKLQLLVYASAVRAAKGDPALRVRSEYSFVRYDIKRPRIGYEVTDTHVEALRDALGVIVSGIEAGAFPAHPPTPGYHHFVECVYCDPDGLGTATRYVEWTAKRSDPALAAFVRLRDGDPGEDPS